MNKLIHYIGLDVHKESIAVSIAPQNSTEVRRYPDDSAPKAFGVRFAQICSGIRMSAPLKVTRT
jgi:hypothetical protein